ncbi:MAG: GGDEF domain-containing protein [Pseudohongiellaceae bacterium]
MDIRDRKDQNGLKFQAAVTKFVCISGLIVAIPFSLWHLTQGIPQILIMLLPAIAIQATALYLLVRDGFNPMAALMVAVIQIAGSVFYVHLAGSASSYWLFTSSVANFFLVSWFRALVLNLLCGIAVSWLMRENPDFVVRFGINYLMVNLFLFAYTYQLEKKTGEVSHLLYRDPLTMTGNRLALDAALAHAKEHRDRYGTPFTLLMLDLDHFKRINDAFGHTTGDRLLVMFARTVEQRLRATDGLYRFGGEEFMVIAENTALEQAAVLADDIRRLVSETAFPPTEGITLSIGLAELQSDESTDSWLNRTDQALYKAKDAGRNRIRNAIPDAPAE